MKTKNTLACMIADHIGNGMAEKYEAQAEAVAPLFDELLQALDDAHSIMCSLGARRFYPKIYADIGLTIKKARGAS